MLNALPAHRLLRRPAAWLVALLCAALLAAAATPAPGLAQSSGTQLVPAQPQTKEEAKQAQEAADKAAADNTGGSVPLIAWFGIAGVILIGGALFFMFRDSTSTIDPQRRAAPRREPVASSNTRGAPKGMFDGDGGPGGQVGRTKKRAAGKRQRSARKASRR